jgi:hypothetical protein
MTDKRSRSILEELNSISVDRDKNHILENRVQHLVSTVNNIRSMLSDLYEDDTAADLEKRLMNSLKSGDSAKFSRGLKKVTLESKKDET